jgi:hypothetical protein
MSGIGIPSARCQVQTLAQLLDLDDKFETWTVVAAIEDALLQKHGYEDTTNLTDSERNVLAVLALEREVMNGGYSLFFTTLPSNSLR